MAAKKKDNAVAAAVSSDVINILKDGKDPEIFPGREKYPAWLFDLVGPSFST